ncbi:MAG: sulfotransferase domain-containing protein [bacterium]|nr:sulfotransferase domain-containing protein [bacterium]
MTDPNQPLVNFLIVGAQRGGTTTLARYLQEHEDIFMAPCKEVHFFDRKAAPDGGWGDMAAKKEYESFFDGRTGESSVGEATPIYMYLPEVAARIGAYNPSMKLIFLLREPGERAMSQYRHERQLGREVLPLWLAILTEGMRLRLAQDDKSDRSSWRCHSYSDRGHYASQIKRCLEEFPRNQMLFLRSEDLFAGHSDCLERVFDFLGVAQPASLPESARHNQAPGKANRNSRAARRVARACLPSTCELEELLGWDLSTWKDI